MIIMHFFSFFTQFLIYLGWIIKCECLKSNAYYSSRKEEMSKVMTSWTFLLFFSKNGRMELTKVLRSLASAGVMSESGMLTG